MEKVVLITGCSSGIGEALAGAFHTRGCRVVATARRAGSMDHLARVGITVHTLDVRNDEQIKEIVNLVMEKEKRIDILVNNAGYALIGPAVEIPGKELELQFKTNVFAPMVMAQKIAPIMKKQGGGLIINMGSVSGITTTPFSGAYCASKAALHALSDALRMELAPFGIRVMTVQPGGIQTRFGESSKERVDRVLNSRSWYWTLEDHIRARAEISQINAMAVDEFTRKLVSAALTASPPFITRMGSRSILLPLMKKILPLPVLDRIFKKKFGLLEIR